MERSRWWREKEFAFLMLFVAATYFVRLDAVTIRGEEATRWEVGQEMQRAGDWFTPRTHGELFTSRPPLQNWIITGTCRLLGSDSPWAIRAHSALATLLICLLIYGYCRLFLTRAGALAAALTLATFGEMMMLGSSAETEALYIAFLAGALIVWHWGHISGLAPTATWILSYSLLALAALCKGGLQPPVYFLGGVGAYLLFTNNLRAFFPPAHLAGLAAGGAIVAAWMIPYALLNGWSLTMQTWMSDTSGRFRNWQLEEFLVHLGRFPVELIGCTFPWILVLVAYAHKDVRAELGRRAPAALFMALAAGLAFLTCWIPPAGQPRYYSPLYPCLAVLVGVAIDVIATSSLSHIRVGWLRMVWGGVVLLLGTCITIAASGALSIPGVLSFTGFPGFLATPLILAALYLAFFGVLTYLTWTCRRGDRPEHFVRGVAAFAVCLAVFYMGFFTDGRIRHSEDVPAAMAHAEQLLPRDAALVSLSQVDLTFVYYYGQPVPMLPFARATELPSGSYFCFWSFNSLRPPIPFPWREIAAVCTDRNHRDSPESEIVIGVRLPEATEGMAQVTSGREHGVQLDRQRQLMYKSMRLA